MSQPQKLQSISSGEITGDVRSVAMCVFFVLRHSKSMPNIVNLFPFFLSVILTVNKSLSDKHKSDLLEPEFGTER